ncbi:MAG: adenylyltransferase/cytidyltransferase family protein [Candidatus Omnitrophica bacterium]|nr:adenylyltransferase/cytidyltransferase family protein [Candidatus Omnitrophota bacterium]
MMDNDQKIKALGELQRILEAARADGRRVVHCHGVFDLLHPGHILHFKEARKQGDLLVVTVTPDRFVRKGPGRPVFNQRLRLESIAALETVDYAALNEWPTAVETIQRLKPHVYVKGQDYAQAASDVTGRIVDEEAAVKAVGGRLVFTNEEAFSSSHILNRFFSAYPDHTQQYLQAFRQRYRAEQVIDALKRLEDLRVLVVGEAILDQYCYCFPMGKSPKETIVSTRFVSEEHFAGGSLAVANHLAGFCREVTLLTALGAEAAQQAFIRSKLKSNVRLEVVITEERPTIRKRRYLEPNFLTKMFEVEYLDDAPIPEPVERTLHERLQRLQPAHDMVAVSDFGHGLMTEPLRQFLSTCGAFLALNSQSNSANLGFNPVTKYARADFVCIDEPELKLAAGSQYGALPMMAEQVKARLRTGAMLVSRGPGGSLILSDGAQAVETPALATKVVDRTGAGDALFAIASPCVYRRLPVELVGFIGNCVGALAVEIVCNRDPVDPILLQKFVTSLLR